MQNMTTIFFLRHGPTKENKENRIQGQQPGNIIVRDTEQYLAAVIPLLRDKQIDLLLSSDLERAVKTRTMLKGFLQLPQLKESITPLLREKAMGFYEGMIWEEVPAAFQDQRGQDLYNFRQFGGENNEDVLQRVQSFLQHTALQYPHQHVCCVTHAGWLKQLAALAQSEAVASDGWTMRTAIYEAGLGPVGKLSYFHPIPIKAELPDEDD